jgi:hypothetical protein
MTLLYGFFKILTKFKYLATTLTDQNTSMKKLKANKIQTVPGSFGTESFVFPLTV